MPFLPVAKLQRNDHVAIVAPSSPFDAATFERGVRVLAERYDVRVGNNAREGVRYLAGSDAQRVHDFAGAFSDPTQKAVFAARGGYGAMRVLLYGDAFTKTPKPLVGFSDITALHLAMQNRGLRSVHGPVVTQLGNQPPEVVERLFAILEGGDLAPLKGSRVVNAGIAEGPLLGGNLSVLSSLVGTPYLPTGLFRGAVLLLEDVGERPYRLDRMLTHLRLAGVLDGLAGIVLGEFTGCDEKEKDKVTYTSAEVLDDVIAALALTAPCVAGFDIGHGTINQPVVLGARVRLDSSDLTLTHLEGLCA